MRMPRAWAGRLASLLAILAIAATAFLGSAFGERLEGEKAESIDSAADGANCGPMQSLEDLQGLCLEISRLRGQIAALEEQLATLEQANMSRSMLLAKRLFLGFDPLILGPGDKPLVAVELLRGRPLIVHFYSTYCLPCVEEFKRIRTFLNDLAKEGGRRRFDVLMVAHDRKESKSYQDLVDHLSSQIGASNLESVTIVRDEFYDFHRRIMEGSAEMPQTVLLDDLGEVLLRIPGPTKTIWNVAEVERVLVP